jgi:hypothetical protein
MLTQPERRSRTKEQYPHIGFYVARTTGTIIEQSLLIYVETAYKETTLTADNLVDGTRFQDSRDCKKSVNLLLTYLVSVELELEAGNYAVIPCSFKAGIEMPFILTLYTSEALDLKPAKTWTTVSVEVCLRYCKTLIRLQGEWKVASNTAGGCANTPSWKQNNQYLLTVTKAEEISLILCRTKDPNNDIYVGFYVVKPETGKK